MKSFDSEKGHFVHFDTLSLQGLQKLWIPCTYNVSAALEKSGSFSSRPIIQVELQAHFDLFLLLRADA